jgi:tetratricopeptide (TPR) repeat protein
MKMAESTACRINRGRATLWVVLWLLAGTVANASEQSKRLSSRGLVELNARHYAEAMQLFDRAVEADPKDAYARYYRGVTRARRGDYGGAISDLRQVVLSKAPISQAPLELGIVLVQASQYREAVQWLEQAQQIPRLEARAALFLGIAQLRLGDSEAAARNFDRAARNGATRLSARYYQGVVAYQQSRWLAAEEYFSYVDTHAPDSEMGHEARLFLRNIHGQQRPVAELYGGLALQYDSNVVIAPSNSAESNQALRALGISRQDDGLGVILAGGTYVPWHTDRTELSLGYEFYQSLYFNLTDFDMQDHRPRVQLFHNFGPVQAGVEGRYDFYLLGLQDISSFLSEATAFHWIEIPEADFGRAEVYYRMRYRDFLQNTYEVQTGFNHAVGAHQFFYFGSPDRYVGIGYQYDQEDPSETAGQVFEYVGNQVEAGGGWMLPAAVAADATFRYRNEHYDSASAIPPGSPRRTDNYYEFIVAFRKELNEHFGVNLAYDGTINDSNQNEFQYDRNIVSIGVDARFH